MKHIEIPEDVAEKAINLAKQVSFLTEKEKSRYAGAIASAIMWAKSTEKQ